MEGTLDDQTERLERAMKAILGIIRNRPDARRYVPVIQRLERAMAESRSDDDELKRILEMATSA